MLRYQESNPNRQIKINVNKIDNYFAKVGKFIYLGITIASKSKKEMNNGHEMHGKIAIYIKSKKYIKKCMLFHILVSLYLWCVLCSMMS